MTTQPTSVGKRIVFLDSLRAIAVLMVLWGHVFLVGINDPNTVKVWITNVTGFGWGPTTGSDNIHGQIGIVMAQALGFNTGGLGVALFFMISGFVILRTVDRTRPLPFMIQRFFRIIPVCLASSALIAGLTYLYCNHYSSPFPHSLKGVITSGFAANYFNGSFSSIPVLWTLEIEMIFYIVMAIAAACFKSINYRVLLGLSVCCLLFVCIYSVPYENASKKADIFRHFSAIFVHISYMLIGSFIYRAWESKDHSNGASYIAAAISIYIVNFVVFEKATVNSGLGTNLEACAAAMLIFVIGMMAGMTSKYYAPLRWVASISYPLYLLHIPIAWAILYMMASMGFGMYVAGVTSCIVVILISWGMHHAVELPSQKLGKLLSSARRKNFALPADGKAS